jgi:hypothetical protein
MVADQSIGGSYSEYATVDWLASSMLKYLIDRIRATTNIVLLTRTEILRLAGSRRSGVTSVTWRHRDTGVEAGTSHPTRVSVSWCGSRDRADQSLRRRRWRRG